MTSFCVNNCIRDLIPVNYALWAYCIWNAGGMACSTFVQAADRQAVDIGEKFEYFRS